MKNEFTARIEHLKMIQTNIARMASNSFIVKGWAITSIGAMYAYWLTNKNNFLLLDNTGCYNIILVSWCLLFDGKKSISKIIW